MYFNPVPSWTEVIYTVNECVTKKRAISVLCWGKESDIRTLLGKRELRRNKGQSVTFLGHDNCTSNIPADDSIGNERDGQDSAWTRSSRIQVPLLCRI